MATQAWLDILRCPQDGESMVTADDPSRAQGSAWRCRGGHPIGRRRGHREAGLARAHDGPRRSHESHVRPPGTLLRLERAARRAALRRSHRSRESGDRRAPRAAARHARARGLPGPGVYQKLLADHIGPSGQPRRARSVARHAARLRRGAPAGTEWTRCWFRPTRRTCRSPTTRSTPSFTLAASSSSASPAAPWTSSSGWPGRAPWWPGATRASAAGAPTGWRRRALQRMNPGFAEPVPPLPEGRERRQPSTR